MIADPDRVKSQKATAAMFQMKKPDIATLQPAFDS